MMKSKLNRLALLGLVIMIVGCGGAEGMGMLNPGNTGTMQTQTNPDPSNTMTTPKPEPAITTMPWSGFSMTVVLSQSDNVVTGEEISAEIVFTNRNVEQLEGKAFIFGGWFTGFKGTYIDNHLVFRKSSPDGDGSFQLFEGNLEADGRGSGTYLFTRAGGQPGNVGTFKANPLF